MSSQNITKNSELLPCPFCGGEAEVCEGGINGKMRVYGLVEHKDGCFFLADGLPTKYQHIMERDFAAWNTRAERTCRDEGGIGSKFPAAFVCSECGWCSTVFAFGKDMPCYCPNCGAKVVGE